MIGHDALQPPILLLQLLETAEVAHLEPADHRRGIVVAHAAYPIHTGRLEGVNNKIKLIKRRSYGFRDPTYFTLKVKQAIPGGHLTLDGP